MNNNAFFKKSDPRLEEVGGMTLLPSWWSRPYEYAWAIQFAKPGQVVADLGAGWSGRPFKEELASVCKTVYAVDKDERILSLPVVKENIKVCVADFEQPLPIPLVDVVFCISVLEDLIDYEAAVQEFYNILVDGGKLVITCDSQYDDKKPLPKYPGVSFSKLFSALQDAGFYLPDGIDLSLENAVYHDEWNLACWHMVLTKGVQNEQNN